MACICPWESQKSVKVDCHYREKPGNLCEVKSVYTHEKYVKPKGFQEALCFPKNMIYYI